MNERVHAAGLTVSEHLTLVNYGPGGAGRGVEYLVVHYVGATGSARQNAEYYHSVYRGASAHYFVDFDGSVVRVVADRDVAWHCGTQRGYRHPRCRNHNSIGIELCVRNDRGNTQDTGPDAGWYFEPETLDAARRLLRVLMDQYGIPRDHVLRHYDVTGKRCPAPFCNGQLSWAEFKAAIPGATEEQEEMEMTDEEFEQRMARYLGAQAARDGAPWSQDARAWAVAEGLIRGDGAGGMGWGRAVTVEQLAAVLHRYHKLTGTEKERPHKQHELWKRR